ncbi:S-adenosyl-L-methionine-dependent methyltransferase [Cristinia sonorae]|uniref:tRNA (cytosine(38)-C(5))-methyltransferase n=1 Tax=Cristinia sonorae TaxID=1940300 RepID=A0A8K0XQY9_9AGAR|nr:S-adenosyl-L-methionine-dependent methyltransferase [Cristinia sonorae]
MADSENRVLEFYSGIGGLHAALNRSAVCGQVIQAFDWDQSACQVYKAFHKCDIVQKTDISTLSASYLASFEATVWLMSPSCQPYTVLNPLAKGAADPRAKSFIHLIENVLPELVTLRKHPKFLLVENVAGFETSTTRKNLLQTLTALGYSCLELLLTPLQYGIPNSRLRYYLLAKIKPLSFLHTGDDGGRVWRHIPGQGEDWSDPRLQSDLDTMSNIKPLHDFLDMAMPEDTAHQLSIPEKVLEKWGRLFDIVTPFQRRTCCFTRGYTKLVERAGSILQMNEELNVSNHPQAVKILQPLALRYFSPTELLRIFGFNSPRGDGPASWPADSEAEYRWPDGISLKTRYKLIGNSVNVLVVTRLIDYLFLG